MTENTARAKRQRRRDSLKKEKEGKIDIRKTLSAILFFSLIGYVIFMPIFKTQILIAKGVCTTGYLTEETERIRYHKATIVYKFQIGDKTYKGNSNIEDLSQAGKNICIVYYPEYPSINRPLSRFEGKVKCDCK